MKLLTRFVLSFALFFSVHVALTAANTQAIHSVVIREFAYASNAVMEVLIKAESQLAADPRKKFKKQKRRTPIDRKRKMKNGKNCPSF